MPGYDPQGYYASKPINLCQAAWMALKHNTDVLLALAPVAGPGRAVAAAPELAAVLGYDIQAALEEPDDH